MTRYAVDSVDLCTKAVQVVASLFRYRSQTCWQPLVKWVPAHFSLYRWATEEGGYYFYFIYTLVSNDRVRSRLRRPSYRSCPLIRYLFRYRYITSWMSLAKAKRFLTLPLMLPQEGGYFAWFTYVNSSACIVQKFGGYSTSIREEGNNGRF